MTSQQKELREQALKIKGYDELKLAYLNLASLKDGIPSRIYEACMQEIKNKIG